MKGSKLGLLLGAVCLIAGRVQGDEPVKVHAVTDIAHEFSFYGDHRFHSQYLPGERGVTNWCSLFNFDFSNANLLILLGCDDRISYFPQDVETIKVFLKSGGGVVLLGGHNARSQRIRGGIYRGGTNADASRRGFGRRERNRREHFFFA